MTEYSQGHDNQSLTRDQFEWFLVECISAYYRHFPTGGNLHVVLDDGNVSVGLIEWCREEAVKNGDHAGAWLASLLLVDIEMTELLCEEDPCRWHSQ